MYIVFHIGKSGGEGFRNFLNKNNIRHRALHIDSPKINNIKILNNNNHNKIILLRDPVKRYMSVFYFWLRAHNYCISNKEHSHIAIVKNNLKYFDKFKTFENLVSALRSENNLKDLASECINNIQHLPENLSYYLGSKELIEKNKNKILFIIEQENYKEDFNNFNKFLNKKHNTVIDNNFCDNTKKDYIRQKNDCGCTEDLYYLSKENEIFLKEYLHSEYKIYEYLKSIKKEVNNRILS